MINNLLDIIESVEYVFPLRTRPGLVYCGRLKRIMSRKDILETPIILYNERSYKITGVEAPCLPDPLREGLNVGILMVEIPSINVN